MATTDVERVFLDTNVLIRATIASAPLHDTAQAALARFKQDNAELWISQQVIREYMVNVTRPQSYSQPVPMPKALEQIRRFRAAFQVAEETTAVLNELMILVEAIPMGGKQIHDANIVATMLAYAIPNLSTHNVEDFRRFSSYVNVRPLAEEA